MPIEDVTAPTMVAMPADSYPDHHLMALSLKEAQAHVDGPAMHNGITVYLTHYLNSLGLTQKAFHALGGVFIHAVEYSIACALSQLLEARLRNESNVIPLLAEFFYRSTLLAIEADDPDLYHALHHFQHDVMDDEQIDESLKWVVDAFHPVLECLDELEQLETNPNEHGHIQEMLTEAVNAFCVPYSSLPQFASPYMEVKLTTASTAVQAKPKTPEPEETPALSLQPSFEVVHPPEDSPAPETPYVAPAKEEPGVVDHLDGSVGMDVHLDLVRLYTPRRSFFSLADAQWQDTLSQFESPTKDIMALWWRLNSSKLETVRLQEARVMDAACRLLEYLFSKEQLEVLAKRLPMEQVLENILSLVSGSINQPPHMSAPQLRISLVSAAIIALTSQETLMHEAEDLWTAIGLSQEVGLLLATLGNHAEALQERIVKVVPPKHTFSYQ